MAEQFKKNYDKRVIFNKSKQKEFLTNLSKTSKLPWSYIANQIGISKRTLFNWRIEKYSISLNALKKICDITNTSFPKEVNIKDAFWSIKKAAKIGGNTTYKKYGKIGNPELRKKKWLEWWETKGKKNLNSYFISKPINIPEKSKELAEFIGIMIGDGGITQRQITITLNSITDKNYINFVTKLIKKLFKIIPKINQRKHKCATEIKISRTNLVTFCKSIGLLIGNKIKQNVDIPNWIINHNEYLIACIRGLIDTDGSIFLECHKIKGKKYCYPRLSLVSASMNLRLSLHKAFNSLGFSAKLRNNRSVQIENKEEIIKYFDKIGTNNTKHLNRYKEFVGGVG